MQSVVSSLAPLKAPPNATRKGVSLTSIQAVIFDLGDVLVDVLHARAASALEARGLDGGDRVQDAIASSPVLNRFETGELDRQRFHAELCRHARVALAFDDFCSIFCDIFNAVPEMIAVNVRLRAAGLRTYLFSNTSELHFEHIRARYDFLDAFDAHFLSYELKSAKPRASIYEAVERGTKLCGPALLYIDDRQENVEAGAARGWQVIRHVSPGETIAELERLGVPGASAQPRGPALRA